MNLAQLVEKYLAWKQVASGSVSTLRSYRKELDKLLEAVGADLAAEDFNLFVLHRFQMFLANSKLSAKSQSHALAVAKALVKWACNEGMYRENFGAALRGPRLPSTMPQALTVEQVKALLDGSYPTNWPERDRVALELLYCGLRVGELVALDIADRVAADEIIAKGKGRKERKVTITEYGQQALAAYLPQRKQLLARLHLSTPALLINRRGDRLTVRSVCRTVQTVALAKGLSPIHPHQLRTAYATHMLKAGAPLSVVSRLLGHAKLGTTMAYAGGPSWERAREAYDRAFKR
jgi:integrase/recombinase XerD